MIVSEFIGRLGLQTDAASFAKGEKQLGGIGASLGKLGAAFSGVLAGGAIANWIHSLTEQGAALHDQSDRLGMSTQALQEYGLAAKLSGSSAEALEVTLRMLSKNTSKADEGGKELAKTFKAQGIALNDAQGNLRSTDELLESVADALQRTENPTERTALALKLLGRQGAGLLPLLKGGAAGLRELRGEAVALGGGLSDELVSAADELDDNLVRLNFSWRSFSSIIGVKVLPMVNGLVTGMIKVSRWFATTWQKTSFLQSAFAVLGVTALLAARQMIAGWLAAAAPLILIAALVGVVALAIDDIYNLLTGGKSVIGKWLGEWIGVEKIDSAVRSWAAGVEILTAAISQLFKLPLERLKDLAAGFAILSEDSRDRKGRADKIAEWKQAIAKAKGGKVAVPTPFVAGAGGTETSSGARGSGSAPVASGGVSGERGALAGNGMREGRVSVGTAAWAKTALGMGANADLTTSASASAPGAGGGANVNATTNQTINVQSGADAREIARQARKAAQQANAEQAQAVRDALVNRRASGAAP